MTTPPQLAVVQLEHDHGLAYALFFHPTAVPALAEVLTRACRPVNGYTIEATMICLSEKGDPAWAKDLNFDSENDLFSVSCPRRGPLTFLMRRLEKRLDDPAALRRLVRATSFGS